MSHHPSYHLSQAEIHAFHERGFHTPMQPDRRACAWRGMPGGPRYAAQAPL